MSGIDGKLELIDELEALGKSHPVAINAPRGNGLASYLSMGLAGEAHDDLRDGPYWALTRHLLQRLSIWWPVAGYAVMPTLTPWCVRDRAARNDKGVDSWGSPRADGCFRDDNSIIKQLPRPLLVLAPAGSPYTNRKPWRGFTACHIWQDLEDGSISGADQWMYSFMPNLVWLPTPLSSLSDFQPRVQALLRSTSKARFRGKETATSAPYAQNVWRQLDPSSAENTADDGLDNGALASFTLGRSFIQRRLDTIDQFVSGADAVRSGLPLERKIVCSRYTQGMPHLGEDALTAFRDGLGRYHTAVHRGLNDVIL